ncbi:unnamed protein product [Didymodactylos carnosus]|uniref:Uncharacterized protein n=1 Tax=Didymodactylos carnosus TaxID=1234261 RepID=A0A813TVG6_9BILA|nr:unnamed protein product [Didymodactylos carnosus]CAF3605360.1 unnamed protein product [Didymodactylos carnosus]
MTYCIITISFERYGQNKKSKRVTCAHRYSIQKKVRDHKKKMRKEAKKHPERTKKRSKDFKIPKLAPFKEELLQEAEQAKKKKEEEKELKKHQRILQKQKQQQQRPTTLESLVNDAQKRQIHFAQQHDNDDQEQSADKSAFMQEKSRKIFYKEFKKVVDASDIVIQVLDARDPLGSRCRQVEEGVLTSGKGKKLILLLNKIDLIPRDNLDKWLKYLRNEFPTIAFRSSTQTQRDRLGHINLSVKACNADILKSSNKCIGAATLMNLLSNYCRKNDIKTSITVGIVGFPNVGKSSVINSLKRSQACETGSTPGITKQMQTVKLDKLIKLFDSPGIVLSKETDPASLILKNCVRIETIDNPIPAVELLLRRCNKDQMMLQYNLPDFQDVNEFLSKMAIKMGNFKKGGIADVRLAAQRVLSDWTNGKLTYYTEPPERNEIIHTELVDKMNDEFDIDALLATESEHLNELRNTPLTGIQMASSAMTNMDLEIENDDSEENDDNNVDDMDDTDENSDADDNDEKMTDISSEKQSTTDIDKEPSTTDIDKKPSKTVRFTVQVADRNNKKLSKQKAAELASKHEDDSTRRLINRSNMTRRQEFKKLKKNMKRSGNNNNILMSDTIKKLGFRISDLLSQREILSEKSPSPPETTIRSEIKSERDCSTSLSVPPISPLSPSRTSSSSQTSEASQTSLANGLTSPKPSTNNQIPNFSIACPIPTTSSLLTSSDSFQYSNYESLMRTPSSSSSLLYRHNYQTLLPIVNGTYPWIQTDSILKDRFSVLITKEDDNELSYPNFDEAVCGFYNAQRRIGHPYQNRTPPKRKKPRTSFTRLQIMELEKRFHRQKYLASSERSQLAKNLRMTDAQVKTWFQNRRTKWRRQTAEEREQERQAASRLMLNCQHHDTKTTNTIYESTIQEPAPTVPINDSICLTSSSLNALQNLKPWSSSSNSNSSMTSEEERIKKETKHVPSLTTG